MTIIIIVIFIIVLYDNNVSKHTTFLCRKLSCMSVADLQVKLGERIKAIRTKKNLTQNELAIKCDFEKASMSRIESGQSNPTIQTLYKICTSLDIHIIE